MQGQAKVVLHCDASMFWQVINELKENIAQQASLEQLTVWMASVCREGVVWYGANFQKKRCYISNSKLFYYCAQLYIMYCT